MRKFLMATMLMLLMWTWGNAQEVQAFKTFQRDSIAQIVLYGTDVDSVYIPIPDSRGYFTFWVTPDTLHHTDYARTPYTIGDKDSIKVEVLPTKGPTRPCGNSRLTTNLNNDFSYLCEVDYYVDVDVPLAKGYWFFVSHTDDGEPPNGDTLRVIIGISWQ